MSEETKEAANIDDLINERISGMSSAEKDLYLRILFLLNQSDRYVKFIDSNFDIHTAVHEETKSIDVAVIEKPLVKETEFKTGELELDVAKSLKAQMILKHNGCKNTAQVMKSIVNILTGGALKEDKPKIVTSASNSDINKELEVAKAANKLKGN